MAKQEALRTCAPDFRRGWRGKQGKAFGERFDGERQSQALAPSTEGGTGDLDNGELVRRWAVLGMSQLR